VLSRAQIMDPRSTHARRKKFGLPFGFEVEGLATTNPDAAPGTLDPVEPILFSTPCNAIGLSEAMKLESEPVARSSCRRYSKGVAKEYCVKNVAVPASPASRDM